MSYYYAGTSNLVLPVRNKSFFPPEFAGRTRLTYYASLFNSIEINASFYRMPISRTISKWETEVPDNFRFSFKLIKEVTHCGKQQFNLQPIAPFMDLIAASGKRGCLLIQLPPKFGRDDVQLDVLLQILNGCGWPIAIEFRNPGWYNDNVYRLLADSNTAMVLHDKHGSQSPLETTSDDFTYLRFHGPENGYRGSYTDDFLYEYAGYICEWLNEGKTVYAYFNNTLGAAVQNLQTLNQFVLQQS
ncbi:MAG TPA: DUF72 domain-containing protein [Mucilaginibacter sp.]